jgi:hypothetical protein
MPKRGQNPSHRNHHTGGGTQENTASVEDMLELIRKDAATSEGSPTGPRPSEHLGPLEKIWSEQLYLEYPSHQKLFKSWWNSLARALRRELAAAADAYADFDDFLTRGLPGSLTGQRTVLLDEARYERVRPTIPPEEHARLLSSENPLDAVAVIDRYKREIDQFYKAAYGLVVRGRGATEEDRDRFLSWLRYEGTSLDEAVDICNRMKITPPIKIDAAKSAIERSRKKREVDTWAIRVWIAKIQTPITVQSLCTQCRGRKAVQSDRRPRESIECPGCKGVGYYLMKKEFTIESGTISKAKI